MATMSRLSMAWPHPDAEALGHHGSQGSVELAGPSLGARLRGTAAAQGTAFLWAPDRNLIHELEGVPKLHKKPRIKLQYQTTEIYKTDIGDWLDTTQVRKAWPVTKSWGSKWACETWIGDKMIGETAAKRRHPSITFHGSVKHVGVHLEDITPGPTQGTVYWHGRYEIEPMKQAASGIKNKLLGLYELDGSALPSPGGVFQEDYVPFRKPCVPPNDSSPHDFKLTIWTQDGFYSDDRTPWGDREGFRNFSGPEAYIGFQVVRMPLLKSESPSGQFRSESGMATYLDLAKPYGSRGRPDERGFVAYTGSRIKPTMIQRVLYGQEDPFTDITGKNKRRNGRYYYDYIIDMDARRRNFAEYLSKYAPPTLDFIPYYPRSWHFPGRPREPLRGAFTSYL